MFKQKKPSYPTTVGKRRGETHGREKRPDEADYFIPLWSAVSLRWAFVVAEHMGSSTMLTVTFFTLKVTFFTTLWLPLGIVTDHGPSAHNPS